MATRNLPFPDKVREMVLDVITNTSAETKSPWDARFSYK